MCLVCAICGPKVKVMHGCVNNCMHGAFFSRGIICLMLLRVYRNSIVVFFSIIKSLFFGEACFSIPLQAGVFFSSKFIKQIQLRVSSTLTSIKW